MNDCLHRIRGICYLAIIATVIAVQAVHAAPESPQIASGLQFFQQHRWLDALAQFLDVLKQDPDNAKAHKYIPLTIREIEAQNHAVVREMRLTMLSGTSQRLGDNHPEATLVESAAADITHSEERHNEDRWNRWLEEAKVERQEGHLLAANDLVLRILAEKQDHQGAQQELSVLQSAIRTTLDTSSDLLVQERFALEGFYAYGQADFHAAAAAWGKAQTLVQQTYPAPAVGPQLATLRFETYAKYAQAQVAAKEREAKIDARFQEGVELCNQGHFGRALEAFREVALAKPEYPQLSIYLVKAETGVEQERTYLLTEARRQEIATYLQKGVDRMEHEKYNDAQEALRHVLELDPSNPTAKSYLAAVQSEIQRLHDPRAAQMHYEAGLIAYASGKLDEAVREWRIASRMDPQNEKAVNAFAKAKKELTFAQELP